ncbi:DUF2442 domain-containing protein [Aeoliella mucimassa]|uniref:DUF2442 domain-containing protein n=1 Tax=Aeoliella mucimassa TaxID=2527972 RepID=A0A518ALD6_9BACT|nr:DUF2442 domain-containing protein [Aeoliella mucimassa]QDU55543.1 hypothetical protein Pan181_17350 [Aeoliella mucimassa]
MLLHIEYVEPVDAYQLRLRFSNATEKVVDVSPLLQGPVFVPIRDLKVFRQVKLDPIAKTVSWPSGADLAPEALLALPEVADSQASAVVNTESR